MRGSGFANTAFGRSGFGGLIVLAAGPAQATAPAVSMFGSYFPSWLICLFAGVIGSVVLRGVFIVLGVDDVLRWRVPVYMALALALTYLLSFLLFGR